MISSTMPSAKYSCPGSPLMFLERQDRYGGAVGKYERRSPNLNTEVPAERTTRYTRTGRTMFLRAAHPILNIEGDLAARVIEDCLRYADAPRLRQSLQPGSNVHSIAIEVSPIDDHVAEVDPDAELYTFLLRTSALRLCMPCWTSIAQPSASTTLGNSTRIPSPVVFTTRPRYCLFLGRSTLGDVL